MFATSERLGMTLEELEQIATKDQCTTKAWQWILSKPEVFLSPEEATPLAYGCRPLVYHCDLTDVDPNTRTVPNTSTATSAEPVQLLPKCEKFTSCPSILRRPLGEFEAMRATRTQAVREGQSETSQDVSKCFMDEDDFYCVRKFHEFAKDSWFEHATKFLDAWQGPAALSTRDIEAKGGGLSFAATRASHVGRLAGEYCL